MTPFQRGAHWMLETISKGEGWEESREHYLKLLEEYTSIRKRKYSSKEEAHKARNAQALASYYRRKGITAEAIQKRIDEKRNNQLNSNNISI